MVSRLQIDIKNGRPTEKSRSDFYSVMKIVNSEDGGYLFTITKQKRPYNPGRYAYYFDCVLGIIFPTAVNYCGWQDGGKFKPVVSIDDFHEWLKVNYNRRVFINKETGEQIICGVSTRELEDKDFIGKYSEQILADFSGYPYLCEVPTLEEWREMHEFGSWQAFKASFYETV